MLLANFSSIGPKSMRVPWASLTVWLVWMVLRLPFGVTTSHGDLDRLVRPRMFGSLGFRVTSATGPPDLRFEAGRLVIENSQARHDDQVLRTDAQVRRAFG